MNKPASIFAAIAVTSSIAAAHFWMQLREERATKAGSQVATQPEGSKEPDQELPEVHIVAPQRERGGP
jgi:hypothetical protein